MQNKIGIACITTAFYPLIGGSEVQLKNLAVFLSREGFDLTIYTYPVKEAPVVEVIDGIKVIRPRILINRWHLTPLFFLFSAGFELFKNRKNYTIIQAHQLPMGIIAGVIGKLLKKRAVVKIESNDEVIRYKASSIKVSILKWCIDRFISLGHSCTNLLISMGIPEKKIIHIPNAFDSKFKQGASRIEDYKKKVLFIARLEHEKAPDILIKAWHIVFKKNPDARLIMLGDGRKRPELENLISELNITGSVEIKGFVNNVRDYLASATILVLPSRIEGVPIAMLEAMAMGVPVIVTPVGDIPGIIKDGENGIFVRPEDIEGLADAISDLLSSQEKRQALSEKARVSIQDFSMDNVGRRYIELYEELLHER
jgi:glycosyltransferase involved in cell wall biosynthesis